MMCELPGCRGGGWGPPLDARYLVWEVAIINIFCVCLCFWVSIDKEAADYVLFLPFLLSTLMTNASISVASSEFCD